MSEGMINGPGEHTVGKTAGDIPIPLLGGRPEREAIISSDDIVNLQIALHTCTSLDEFLEGL